MGYGDGSILQHQHDSKPRNTIGNLDGLAHPLACRHGLLACRAVPFVVVRMTAGFIMEALFVGIPLRRSRGSDWTRPLG